MDKQKELLKHYSKYWKIIMVTEDQAVSENSGKV